MNLESKGDNEREAIEVIFKSDIDLFEKVYALDKIYGCNLNLTETGYRNLCKKLETFNEEIRKINAPPEADKIVNRIATIPYKCKGDITGLLSEKEQKAKDKKGKDIKTRNVGFVFASKYCYFTRQTVVTRPTVDGLFIIYDKYADIAISYLESEKGNNIIWKAKYNKEGEYEKYTEKVREVLDKLKGEKVSYRDLDKYLWLFGQVLEANNNKKVAKFPTRINYIIDYNQINLDQLKNNLSP